MLRTLALQGDERLAVFEQRHSLATVVATVDTLPTGLVDGAIKRYQNVIRSNAWYFATLRDVDVSSFLARWGEVHAAYFALADDIFALLVKGEPLSTLATSSLLTRVIQSETMRGWVGKRSPSGLDALLDARVTQLEDLLAPLGIDAVDDVLSYGGVYVGDPSRITAEREIVELFATYHREVGRELTVHMLDEPNAAALSLLRSYCRYSLDGFNAKYRILCGGSPSMPRPGMTTEQALDLVAQRLAGLATDKRDLVLTLLDEVKVLNHLNLNLEVKYSFKGWAGLMHVLVFAACSEATSIGNDVHAMRNALIEAGE